MIRQRIILCFVCAVAGSAIWAFAAADQPAKKCSKARTRIGTFDSRAVAVAYAHSDWNDKKLKAKMAEMKKAKAAGDTKKIEELEKWGKTQQDKLHRQGFSTASVHDILENIKNDMPRIAEETGVDIIVSRWDIVYQNPSAELVDITDEIVKPFNPDPKTLKIIKDLLNQPPLPEEVLEKMHCEESAKHK